MSEQSKQPKPTPLDGVDPTKDPVGAVKACIKTWDELEIQSKQRNAEFLKGPAVASIQSGLIMPDAKGRTITPAVDWWRDWMNKHQHSGVFQNHQIGEIVVSARGIKNAMSHRMTIGEMARRLLDAQQLLQSQLKD